MIRSSKLNQESIQTLGKLFDIFLVKGCDSPRKVSLLKLAFKNEINAVE